MDPIRTGAWIAARRKEQKLTQRDLAARLGVTDKAVSRWETGKGYPDISLLPELAEALNCTVNEVLSGRRLDPREAPAAAEENLTALCRTAGQPSRKHAGLLEESRVELQADRIEIRWGFWHLIGAGIALWLIVLSGSMVVEALPAWSDWKWGLPEVIELFVLSGWLLLSLLFAFSAIFVRPRRLVLDREGVLLRRLLRTKRFSWDQVRDYGIGYLLHDRDHVLYTLYFSDTVLESDDAGRRKYPRSALRIHLQATVLDRYVTPIMDFCAGQTQAAPFLVYPYDRLYLQQRREGRRSE